MHPIQFKVCLFFSGAFRVYSEFTHRDTYEKATIFRVGEGRCFTKEINTDALGEFVCVRY